MTQCVGWKVPIWRYKDGSERFKRQPPSHLYMSWHFLCITFSYLAFLVKHWYLALISCQRKSFLRGHYPRIMRGPKTCSHQSIECTIVLYLTMNLSLKKLGTITFQVYKNHYKLPIFLTHTWYETIHHDGVLQCLSK